MMRRLTLCCKLGLAFIVVLILICVIRTAILLNLRTESLPKCRRNESLGYMELTDDRWQRFREVLRFKTVSYEAHVYEKAELSKQLDYILAAHPKVFTSKHVQYEIVNDYSLLVHVSGTSTRLLPYLLAAHLDVVPVVQDEWSVEAFGAVENKEKTLVYGRGAIDCKASLMAILSAVEFMLEQGKRPERSFYLAFGHDEEVRGVDGAGEIAKTLRRNGINKLHFLLDEGMILLRNAVPGVSSDLASVGVTEKGFLTLNISVSLPGGHSSMPPKESAVGLLSKAVARLESNPMTGMVDGMFQQTIEALAGHLQFPFNVLASNQWLFKPLWGWLLSKHQLLNCFVRTTTAVTVLGGGVKANVIPSTAWAIINHRVHPMNTIEQVIQYDKDVINDERFNFTVVQSNDPLPISPYDRFTSLPYQVLADTIEQVFGEVTISPVSLFANTDTIHYLSFTEHIYRFLPFTLRPSAISSIHAKDEFLSKKNFEGAMNFYYHLLQNADRVQLRSSADRKEEL